MTTGMITQGQAALYVAETTTGKFGVYTMGMSAGSPAGPGYQAARPELFPPTQAMVPAPCPVPLPAKLGPRGVSRVFRLPFSFSSIFSFRSLHPGSSSGKVMEQLSAADLHPFP